MRCKASPLARGHADTEYFRHCCLGRQWTILVQGHHQRHDGRLRQPALHRRDLNRGGVVVEYKWHLLFAHGGTLLLGPVVFVFGVAQRTRRQDAGAPVQRPALIPWFIAGFVVLAVLRVLGWLPSPAVLALGQVSQWLTILAMAGLGMGVDFAALRKVGPRVGLAVCGSLLFLVLLSLSLIVTLHVSG